MPQDAPSARTRVLIVEDNPVTQLALSLAVKSEPTLQLMAAIDTVSRASDWLKTEAVDLLLTDLELPDGSGLEVIRSCLLQHPDCDIMVITTSSDEVNVLACIEAGAAGYLLKSAGKLDIVHAILDLLSGGSPMSPVIARKVLDRVREARAQETVAPAAKEAVIATLTKRESVILELIAQGDAYGAVADALSISVSTVQAHIKNIYSKLSVHSRGEAVFEAQRQGLLKFGGQRKS